MSFRFSKKQSGHKGYAQCWPLIFTYMCTHMDTGTPHTNAYIHLYTHINTGNGKCALFTKKLGEQKAPSVLFIQSFFIWWKRLSWCFLNSKAYHYDRNTQLWFAKHLKMCKTINLLMGSHISSEQPPKSWGSRPHFLLLFLGYSYNCDLPGISCALKCLWFALIKCYIFIKFKNEVHVLSFKSKHHKTWATIIL